MYKRIFGLSLLVLSITAYADSTQLAAIHVNATNTPFLLEHGQVYTTRKNGSYVVSKYTTDKRCPEETKPTLVTNISSIEIYGGSQGIEGLTNTLALNPKSYYIFGEISVPMSVELTPHSGATINWQVWCQPIKSV